MLELDISIIILLLINIVYCWNLNKKIVLLRNSRQEIQKVINSFNTSVKNAQDSIAKLKTASRNSTKDLHGLIEKSAETCSDLHYLIDSGEAIANKLEDSLSKSKRAVNNNVVPFSTDNIERNKNQMPQEEKKDLKNKIAAIENILHKVSRNNNNPREKENIKSELTQLLKVEEKN